MKTVRVLQVFGALHVGGGESRMMDLYRSIDKSKVQFDFVVHTQKEGFFEKEIREMGGKIYRIPRFKAVNYSTYKKAWKKLFEEHKGEWVAVHGNMTSTAGIYLPEAKAAGVPLTIAHARSAGVDPGPKGWLTKFLRRNLKNQADQLFTVSEEATKAVFGKDVTRAEKIPGAMHTEKLVYQEELRDRIRKEYHVEDAFLVGHVGSFRFAKNHSFLLDVFKEIKEKCPSAKLMLVGDGELRNDIKEKIKALSLMEDVILTGVQGEVQNFYQAFDVMIFPSHYEGLPGAVVEAQCSGLPVLVSDAITKEACLTDLVEYVPLSLAAGEWATKALAKKDVKRESHQQALIDGGFDAKTQAEKFERLYLGAAPK